MAVSPSFTIRRRLSLVAGLSALAGMAPAQPSNPPAVSGPVLSLSNGSKPNFVFIIGDDISAEDLGCYGNPGIRTPNLDRLAAESRRFTNAYVTASSCSPSRCSILTGRYPHNLETAAELHAPLPPGVIMFPRLLRAAGYYSAHAGKSHFGLNRPGWVEPASTAFDLGGPAQPGEPDAGNGGEDQWLGRLRSRPLNKPFFMWFASKDAHRPWNADSFTGLNRPEDVRVPPYLVDTPETRRELALYYDEITRLDHHVGEVLQELKRQGVLEHTVVIVTADNGRPFPHSKTQLYEDGVKTPLLIRWPQAVPRPAATAALASLIDLAPTILELAGVPRPETFQGVSLVPVLRDPAATVRDYVFAEHNWHDFSAHVRMVRAGHEVYLRNAWPELPQPGATDTFYNPSADALRAAHAAGRLTPLQANIFLQPRPAEEYYDLSTDPLQANNLINTADAAPLNRLRALLDRWTRETGDSVPSAAERTPSDTDFVTGRKNSEFWRGKPPGAATHALQINAPGPIRETR